jgi:hypothetical protein
MVINERSPGLTLLLHPLHVERGCALIGDSSMRSLYLTPVLSAAVTMSVDVAIRVPRSSG